ncbi:hypothetical protein A11A3_14892 [Alcanivorax hongdengensis A-11-3]|uniref:Uncharacterized protein n=1 Tax=Alcanivorax hongdengensis A-11-3 TaxID=1177179 RepID=L0W875_9GAMM|nr:hypothetical protein [Alcanivorax hongdengensis]EKF73169.1 hypothetical protein A11A3_14892 [Alcanivorax hongdengensis A-11-3]
MLLIRKGFPLLLVLALLSGCATRSLFVPYPNQATAWQSGIGSPQPAATEKLQKAAQSNDGVLYQQELGRVSQLDGERQQSQDAFAAAIDHYQQTDEAARIRASSLVADTSSLIVNDNARPYTAPDYERIFTRAYQALNYWAANDVTGTAVELRAAGEEQRNAARKRDREIAKAEKDADDNQVDLSQYQGYFEGLDAAAGSVKASFQNAWTFYLSALFWEAHGEYNDALVDYKKALEIHPDADFIKEDVQRVSAALNGRLHKDGMVAVIYEQGFVPPRQELSLPIPTVHGVFSVAFPTYSLQNKPRPDSLRVLDSNRQPLGETRVLADVGALAAKNLKEQLPGMLVRQTLRATAKYNAQKKANDDFGALGAFFTQVYNLVSEQADLRSWLTLPAYAQATRFFLPQGQHSLVLSTPGGSATLNVPVVDHGLTVIHVVAVQGHLITRVLPVQEGPL